VSSAPQHKKASAGCRHCTGGRPPSLRRSRHEWLALHGNFGIPNRGGEFAVSVRSPLSDADLLPGQRRGRILTLWSWFCTGDATLTARRGCWIPFGRVPGEQSRSPSGPAAQQPRYFFYCWWITAVATLLAIAQAVGDVPDALVLPAAVAMLMAVYVHL